VFIEILNGDKISVGRRTTPGVRAAGRAVADPVGVRADAELEA
jgi:hypothetical protein